MFIIINISSAAFFVLHFICVLYTETCLLLLEFVQSLMQNATLSTTFYVVYAYLCPVNKGWLTVYDIYIKSLFVAFSNKKHVRVIMV